MENPIVEAKNVTEEVIDNEPLSIVVKKQLRKKREKQSDAQLKPRMYLVIEFLHVFTSLTDYSNSECWSMVLF